MSSTNEEGNSAMGRAKEFRVTIEDRPGVLGACCQALGEHKVNILAFQSFVEQGESLARFVVDQPETALVVLRDLHANFEQEDVAIVELTHQPGQLGRAALKLGESGVNVNYSYSGVVPGSTRLLAVFGVIQLTTAAQVLDEFQQAQQ